MPFPDTEKVIYEKNTLDQVICQLRFAPILKIDAEIPAEFQDIIRDPFPSFSEKLEVLQVPRGDSTFQALTDIFRSAELKNYEFASENEEWKVNLSRTFVALTARSYRRWDEFRKTLEIPVKALDQVYHPSYFSRVGLRYINVIRRSTLGLENAEWKDLIRPHILGILDVDGIGQRVTNFENKNEIRLSDEESVVRIITKFVKLDGEGEEICYSLDWDFFNAKKLDVNEAMKKLDFFNIRAARLFQWCISERLHQAMEPCVL